MATTSSFPSDNIDPKKKNKDWCLQYCKAAWYDSAHNQPKRIFYHNAGKYEKITSYAHGKQDTSAYRPAMHVDQQSNTTFASLDFKPMPFLKNHRQIALGRLQKSQYNIVATAIDALARTDQDTYFQKQEVLISMRQQIQQKAPHLANSPILAKGINDPLDLEELELQKEYGYKHDYAIAAEEGIDLIFQNNDITECRHKIIEDLFDFGVAAYKDWMEPSGKVRFKKCDIRNVITSYCRKPDFSDIRWAGEVSSIPWNSFREEADGEFSDQEFELIFQASKTTSNNDPYTPYQRYVDDSFKVKVLDLEWFSYDVTVYEDKKDKYGNPVFVKADYKKKGKENTKAKGRLNVYKGKWIVGTDYIYDCGLASFQKRPSLSRAELSYHFYACNFHDMTASGVMEDLIPIGDQMSIAWLKLQNLRNELIPYFIDIDFDAIEGVVMGKGGEAMQPKDIISMLFQNKILLTRKSDLASGNPNYKAVNFESTNYGDIIAEAWNDLNNHYKLLSDVTGFNEATDGSTVNPKNLNSTNEAMQESTNNALYHIIRGEEVLLLNLAEAVLTRLKRAVKMGKVEGYIQSLGTGTTKFISVAPDIDDHDFGLVLENKPSSEERQLMMQEMSKYVVDGTLEAGDIFIVQGCRNLKQAEKILTLRINRRKAEKQQQAMQLSQQNSQVQIQSAQAAEQAKRATILLEYSQKQNLEITKGEIATKNLYLELMVKYGISLDQIKSQEKMQMKELGLNPPDSPIGQTPLPQQGQDPNQDPNSQPQMGGQQGQGQPQMSLQPPQQMQGQQ